MQPDTWQQYDPTAEYFSDGNVRAYYLRQLHTLRQFNVKDVRVQFDRIRILIEYEHEQKTIGFSVTLNRMYPAGGVRLYLITSLNEIAMNDLRDYVGVVLGKQWQHQCRLAQILERIPNLLTLMGDISEQPLMLQKIGKYHLGETFAIKFLQTLEHPQLHTVREKTSNGKLESLLIYISDTHIVLLRPVLDSKARVLCYMDIQSIGEIRLDRQKHKMMLRFREYRLVKGFMQEQVVEKNLIVQEFNVVLRKILKNIYRYQQIQTNFQPNTSSQLQIKKHYTAIKLNEEKLKNGRTPQLVTLLNNLYQHMMEHYSKRGDSIYLIFVEKIKNLHCPFIRKTSEEEGLDD